MTGALHPAAVSRVARAEVEPDVCYKTNVEALGKILRVCMMQRNRPGVIFLSSRELSRQQAVMPVAEDTALMPINTYGTRAQLFPMLGAFLHFKFLSDFRQRVEIAVEGAWHGGAERDFLACQAHLQTNETLRLHDEASVRFENSRQLVDLGVILTHPALDAFIASEVASGC